MSEKSINIYLLKDSNSIKDLANEKSLYEYMLVKASGGSEQAINLISSNDNALDDKKRITFAELADEWIQLNTPLLKPSSAAKYNNMLKLYLLPEYGNMQVSSILRKDIINLSRKLLVSGVAKGTGLSPKTVNCVLSLLKGILEYGERENNIPIADVRDIFVKQPQKSMCVLSKKDQEKLTLYLKEHKTPCNMGILLCLYTGLRIGEVCALKWSDIYIEEQNVHVHNTMQRIQISSKDKDHANKTEIVIHKPKSECSIRWIPIPQEICNLLEPFKADDQAFLLTGNKKRYIEPRSMENRFKTVTKECGIDNVNFHALRHTFATRCVELGFDFKSLSEILGHASVNITMNRYVHPSMELKKKNMNLLSELLSNNAK